MTFQAQFLSAGELGVTTPSDQSEVRSFALSVLPGCGDIVLSWQDVYGVSTFKVMRDGKQVAMLYNNETVWVDLVPEDGINEYQIIGLDDERNTICESWKIEAKTSCFDTELCKTVLKYKLDSTDYWVDGTKKGPMDTPPEINLGRMFLVIRYVTQELGAELSWEGTEKKITITTKTGKIIDLWVGRPLAMVDGASVMIDSDNMAVVPYIKEGRTLLPMRFVAEQLGATGDEDVIWDGATKTVTLKVRDEDCPEPDIMYFTVSEIDSAKWLVKCRDSMRNDVYVNLNQEYAIFSATLEPGQKIRTAGKVSIEDRKRISIEARWIKLVDESSVDEVICKPVSCDEKKLIYMGKVASDEEDGVTKEEIELNYTRSFEELESSENRYCVRLLVDEKKNIIWWEPAVFISSNEQIITHSIDLLDVDKEQKRIKVEYDDGELEYTDWIYFPIDFEFDKYDDGGCYKVDYQINDAGNRISKSNLEEYDCTAAFTITSQSDGIEVYPGAEFVGKFVLRNIDTEDSTFKTVAVISIDGEETQLGRDTHDIKSRYNKKISERFTAPNAEGSFKFGIRVISGSTSRTCWAEGICVPLEFELSIPKKEYEFHLNEPVYISASVSHEHDSPLHIVPFVEIPSEALQRAENSVLGGLDVRSGVEKPVNLVLDWIYTNAVAGESYEVTIGVRCKGVSKTETVVIKALDYIPPEVFVSSIENDDYKKTTIYGSINWNNLTPDRIEVDWGDGIITDGDISFPLSHVYEDWGVYKIKVKVISVEGAFAETSEEYVCEDPPPPPPLISSVDFGDKLLDDYTIGLDIEVNWRDYVKGKIHIDWGDGEKSESSRTVYKHKYPEEDFSSYILTIKAVSREGYESPTRKFEIYVLFGWYMLIGEIR